MVPDEVSEVVALRAMPLELARDFEKEAAKVRAERIEVGGVTTRRKIVACSR